MRLGRYSIKVKRALQSCYTKTLGKCLDRQKSAKQALLKWVRENAATFTLTDTEGKQNETGIEEVAKVANWNDKGGAPTTPSK